VHINLRFATLMLVLALAVGMTSRASDPTPRFAHEHISLAEWQTYLEEVTLVPDVRCEDTKRHERYCVSDSLTSIWVFTEPGHPAHPAVSTGVFVTYPQSYGVVHRAYYAGDEPAFRAWAVSALGDLLILDKWKQAASRDAGT
jgi:hypothetical protein